MFEVASWPFCANLVNRSKAFWIYTTSRDTTKNRIQPG
jgi:hypothetical protein